jgi:hemolysin activation/secretion protein
LTVLHAAMAGMMAAALGTSVVPAPPAQPDRSTPFIIDRQRSDRVQPIAPPQAPAMRKVPGAVPKTDQGAHVAIAGIRFDGAQVPQRVAAAAQPFLGRTADAATLNRLAQAMADAYAHTDVALYSVAIPEQDFGRGIVHVRVVEGWIEAVEITLAGERSSLLEAYGAKLRAEHPLRQPTLERYLSLMRDIPGMTIDAKLAKGSAPGRVRLLIAARRLKPTLRFAYDNRATQILGDGQFQALATAYGTLREGDQTDLVASSAPDLHRYRYFGLTHSTPLGYEGTRLALSGGYLRTNPHGTPLHGEARLAGITLSRPLLRGYHRNLTVSVSVDGLDSDNAAFGSLITSERTRAARIAAAFSDARTYRTVTAGVTVSRGLDMLGARASGTLDDPTFTKVNATLAIDQQVVRHLFARLRASGQYARDPLPAVERFVVGGADFGRGFEVALLSADRGAAASGELAWRPLTSKAWGASELYGFIDGASVAFASRPPYAGARYDLASAGGGIRVAFRDRAAVSLELAHPIDNPYPGYRARWQVSVGWTLALFKH